MIFISVIDKTWIPFFFSVSFLFFRFYCRCSFLFIFKIDHDIRKLCVFHERNKNKKSFYSSFDYYIYLYTKNYYAIFMLANMGRGYCTTTTRFFQNILYDLFEMSMYEVKVFTVKSRTSIGYST